MFKPFTLISFVILAFWAWSPPAFAAGYLKLEGIKGETTKDSHKDWIVIESFSHGIGQGDTSATGTTRRRGTVSSFDVTIVKPVDAASPKILEAVTRGKVFPTVTVKYEHNSKSYISTMSNVQITSIKQKDSGEGWPKEHISFTYQKIIWDYEGGGHKSSASWDMKTGR